MYIYASSIRTACVCLIHTCDTYRVCLQVSDVLYTHVACRCAKLTSHVHTCHVCSVYEHDMNVASNAYINTHHEIHFDNVYLCASHASRNTSRNTLRMRITCMHISHDHMTISMGYFWEPYL